MMFALAMLLLSGCTCAVMQATYHPRSIRPVKIPTKRLCVSHIDYLSPDLFIDMNMLNKTLNKYYPSVFARIPTETCQQIGLYYDGALTSEDYFFNGLTYLTFFGTAFITPRIDTFEYTHDINLTVKYKGENKDATDTTTGTTAYTQHYGWVFSNWIFAGKHNFGRYWFFEREELPDMYDALAAQIMATYNANPDIFTIKEEVKAKKTKAKKTKVKQVKVEEVEPEEEETEEIEAEDEEIEG